MSVQIPFYHDYSYEYGVLETVAPGIRRLVARNPGPYTFHGTGTYIIGEGEVAVIDPGPALPAHVDALLRGLSGETITHLLVTHTHLDHSPAAAMVKAHTGAKTYGFGPHGEGKLLRGESVEEGGDFEFDPDVRIGHGDIINGAGWSFEAVHTPGHTSNHLCFQYQQQRTLFSGDHVMGWSTTVISPPDGDMRDYMSSLGLLLERDDAVYWPTHGPCITEPRPYVQAFIAHREERIGQILDCVCQGVHTIGEMVPRMYPDLDPALHSAAARQVFAAVLGLLESAQLHSTGEASIDAHYELEP